MTLRGATGELRWVYMTAAVFGPWVVETSGGSSTLTGRVVSVDEYRMAQPGLTAVVIIGRQRVTWPVVNVELTDQTVTAHLGQRQE